VSRAGHLARRFFESVRAPRADAGDLAFVQLVCTPPELACWQRLGRADQAESLAVARRAAAALGPDADSVWLAAALCHDVGKADAQLRPVGRVVATLVAGVASHGRARHWDNKIGRYVNHDELGARRLGDAGARREVADWARAHHRPQLRDRLGLPGPICTILAVADGEE
jgi:putative nucleotidyltransferase with HDIG domain